MKPGDARDKREVILDSWAVRQYAAKLLACEAFFLVSEADFAIGGQNGENRQVSVHIRAVFSQEGNRYTQ
ncbi:hypothetical protein GCM10010918_45640 [Paenibacillus radicis (ex Gao et al. 2016)]|uniref:Uncharacterized protein n=1 Tax=Paenibacillus radicis (ex Gao et al. 2016) TaxID=1737354 RepID=A0A917HL20_9BACL|nr:hypothetical protein GCM10010918_45640 [Paenibacillus radicis (ex Gao et al. 2016)]